MWCRKCGRSLTPQHKYSSAKTRILRNKRLAPQALQLARIWKKSTPWSRKKKNNKTKSLCGRSWTSTMRKVWSSWTPFCASIFRIRSRRRSWCWICLLLNHSHIKTRQKNRKKTNCPSPRCWTPARERNNLIVPGVLVREKSRTRPSSKRCNNTATNYAAPPWPFSSEAAAPWWSSWRCTLRPSIRLIRQFSIRIICFVPYIVPNIGNS